MAARLSAPNGWRTPAIGKEGMVLIFKPQTQLNELSLILTVIAMIAS